MTSGQFGNVPLTTWCTPQCNAHLVNSDHMVHTQIMNTWCTLGAHLVNSYPDAFLVHTWCTSGEQLTLLSPL